MPSVKTILPGWFSTRRETTLKTVRLSIAMPAPLQISRFAQFHLGTLLWSVAALGICFALLRSISVGGLLAFSMFALLAIAHVLGNMLGTQLRDRRAVDTSDEIARLPQAATKTTDLASVRPQLPAARLRERTALGRFIFVTVGMSAGFGAMIGGLLLSRLTHVSLSGWAVGTCSSAMIAGFVGFMLAGFLEMSFRAWWQATHNGTTSNDA